MRQKSAQSEVIIVGGGLAGLSAAVYLARALRTVTVIDNGKSMARWEPDVQNYLGFPKGISGPKLVELAREHPQLYGAKLVKDEIIWAKKRSNFFTLRGKKRFYSCDQLLLATGIFHIPPDIPGLNACLGHSMFFCKDCDGYRVRGGKVGIFGWTDEAVEYALAMVLYSPRVFIFTNRHTPRWSGRNEARIAEYHIPVYQSRITHVVHECGQILSLCMGKRLNVELDALFTTRGDIYYNRLAHGLGAEVNKEGAVRVNARHQTSVPGLYAAGCVTPANCQMIIAAGEGAAAAQAINRHMFEESLRTHSLRRLRRRQVRTSNTRPKLRDPIAIPVKTLEPGTTTQAIVNQRRVKVAA